MEPDSPFQQKIKVEYTCETCNSNYRLIFFDEEVSSDSKYCPFCGEEVDASLAYENKSQKDDSRMIYTDDEGARYENDLMDDDL